MRATLLSLGLAAVGALALAAPEARANRGPRPVVVGYYAPAYYTPAYSYAPPVVSASYYAPPVVYRGYYVAPAYYPAYTSYYAPAAYSYPAYTSYYVTPAYYGGW